MFIIPQSGFAVKGEANTFVPETDITSILIRERAAQTASPIIVQNSSSTPLWTLAANGSVTQAQGLTVSSGGAAITGNSTVTGTVGITGATTITAAADTVQLLVKGNSPAGAQTNNIVAIQQSDSTSLWSITNAGAVTQASSLTVSAGGLTVSAGGAGITGASSITGSANVTQLLVKGYSTQDGTNYLINATDSSNVSKFSVSGAGAVIQAAGLTVSSGGTTVTGTSQFNGDVSIIGTATGVYQLTVRGANGQSVYVMAIQGYGSTDAWHVSAAGAVYQAASLTVASGGAGITGATTITGSSNAVQLTVKGFAVASQTADLFQVLTDGSANRFSVDKDGKITSANKLTVSTGGADITGNLQTLSSGTITSAGKLTVSSGGADVTGNLQTISGTITAGTGLTVTTGGAGITGATTITGSADAVQLTVKGNATQTNYLLNLTNSSNTSMHSVSGTGVGIFASDLTISGVLKTGSGPVTLTNAAGNIVVSTLVASGTNGQVLTTVGGAVQWSSSVSSSGWNYTAGSPGNISTPSRVYVGQDLDSGAGYPFTVNDGAAGITFLPGPVRLGPSPYFPSPAWMLNIGMHQYQNLFYAALDQTYSPGAYWKIYRPYNVSASTHTCYLYSGIDSASADRDYITVYYDVDDTTSTSIDSSIYYYVYQNNVQKIAYLSAAGVWTDASAAAGKTFVGTAKEVYGSVIDKLKGLYIGKYHAGDPKKEHHFSPTAEDFYKAFQLGVDPENDRKGAPGIAPKDMASLALAGLVELNEKIEALQQELEKLKGKP